jgi:Mce-associated membrane protein
VLNGSTTNDVFDTLSRRDEHLDVVSPSDVEDEEHDDAAQPPAAESRSRRLPGFVLATLAALIFIAAVGLAASLGWQLKQRDDVDGAGRTALDVARTYAVVLTSVDNTKIDDNFAHVIDGATGEFKDMYSQSAAQLRQLLIDNKAVSHGTVVDAAIKSASKNKVDVLIFIDQSISNSVNPEPRIDRSRVAITMEKIDGRWLASKVDIK